MTVVSLYCDDNDDCVFTNDDITVGKWVISEYPVFDGVATVDVGTAAPAEDLWPHQVISWEYWDTISGEMEPDPQLTVTGNININILCLNIDISL